MVFTELHRWTLAMCASHDLCLVTTLGRSFRETLWVRAAFCASVPPPCFFVNFSSLFIVGPKKWASSSCRVYTITANSIQAYAARWLEERNVYTFSGRGCPHSVGCLTSQCGCVDTTYGQSVLFGAPTAEGSKTRTTNLTYTTTTTGTTYSTDTSKSRSCH